MTQALEELSGRIRDHYAPRMMTVEKRMFGSICFLARGNMLVAATRDSALIARVGKDGMADALSHPGCREMAMSGRKMSGFVVVDGDVLEDEDVLAAWLDKAAAVVARLPAK